MRFYNIINEKIDLNYRLKASEVYDSKDSYEIEFNIGETGYTFEAEPYFLEDSEGMKKELGFDPDYDSNVVIWSIAFKLDSDPFNPFGITGEQGMKAMEVFSAVAVCLKKFILTKRPEYFSFSAKERSRVNLYSRFAKMIPKITGKYTMKEFTHKSNKYFLFVRN